MIIEQFLYLTLYGGGNPALSFKGMAASTAGEGVARGAGGFWLRLPSSVFTISLMIRFLPSADLETHQALHCTLLGIR